MKITTKEPTEFENFFGRVLLAALAAVAKALFKPLNAARGVPQPAPVFTHVLYEKFRDGRAQRELMRWQDSRRDIPAQEIDRLFERARFERTIAPYDAASREIMQIAWQFRPAAQQPAPLNVREAHDDPAETFRARLLVGAEPVKSPASLDRRPPLHSPKL